MKLVYLNLVGIAICAFFIGWPSITIASPLCFLATLLSIFSVFIELRKR